MAKVEGLPEDVSVFLDARIDSVEQLQVLLLLHAHPNRTWSIAEITAELRSTDASIRMRLNDLYARHIFVSDKEKIDRHQFNPVSEEIRGVIQKLAEQNQIRPYRVIEAIYSRRDRALQKFADAFKIRGGK